MKKIKIAVSSALFFTALLFSQSLFSQDETITDLSDRVKFILSINDQPLLPDTIFYEGSVSRQQEKATFELSVSSAPSFLQMLSTLQAAAVHTDTIQMRYRVNNSLGVLQKQNSYSAAIIKSIAFTELKSGTNRTIKVRVTVQSLQIAARLSTGYLFNYFPSIETSSYNYAIDYAATFGKLPSKNCKGIAGMMVDTNDSCRFSLAIEGEDAAVWRAWYAGGKRKVGGGEVKLLGQLIVTPPAGSGKKGSYQTVDVLAIQLKNIEIISLRETNVGGKTQVLVVLEAGIVIAGI